MPARVLRSSLDQRRTWWTLTVIAACRLRRVRPGPAVRPGCAPTVLMATPTAVARRTSDRADSCRPARRQGIGLDHGNGRGDAGAARGRARRAGVLLRRCARLRRKPESPGSPHGAHLQARRGRRDIRRRPPRAGQPLHARVRSLRGGGRGRRAGAAVHACVLRLGPATLRLRFRRRARPVRRRPVHGGVSGRRRADRRAEPPSPRPCRWSTAPRPYPP